MSRHQLAAALAVLGVIAAVGCVMFFGSIYITGESTAGRVVDLHWITGSSSARTCTPELEYVVDGRTYVERTAISTSPCLYEVGEEVTVYYRAASPDEPYADSGNELMPLLFPLALFGAAAYLALRKPKTSERIAKAEETTVAAARDGELVKLRGQISLAPGASALVAPLTGRECVVWWTRVMEGKPGEKAETIHQERRSAAFVVTCGDGEARVSADTEMKVAIEADVYGSTHDELFAPLEAFLEERGLPIEPAKVGAHHVWFQGLFREGEEVYVLGRARRIDGGALELAATDGSPVALEHVDRERRKAAGPSLWSEPAPAEAARPPA